MKLWLASYPRSGNTFLRMVLHQSFGITSTSVYGSEDAAMIQRPWLMERIGYAGNIGTVDHDSCGSKWVGVKTHDHPADDHPAIYIVRDGRAAVVSHRHLLRDYSKRSLDLGDMIEGKVWPGSWSDHFAAWNPEVRPHTLLMKYEELKSNIGRSCETLAAFLGVKQKAHFRQNFDELRNFEPTLFRTADNDLNIREMSAHEALFDRVHGSLMRKLGYYR